MSELTAAVDATETLWTVDTVPDPAFGFYTVGSEIIEVMAGFPGGDPGYAVGQTFPSKIRVIRATNGTTAATHADGVALTAANAFSAGGGGVTVDNTVDAPVEVTTLIAPGAVIAGEEADLTDVLTISKATVTLTNAQIKALPTTPVEIIAAQANVIVAPVGGIWIILDATTAGYTNIDGTTCHLLFPGSGAPGSGGIDLGIYDEAVAGALSGGAAFVIYFPPKTGVVAGFLDAGFVAQPGNKITLTCTNGDPVSLGDFTGGHADNSLTVIVPYVTFDLT